MELRSNKKNNSRIFEAAFRRKLIKSVKFYPCLYDQHNKGYGFESLQSDVWEKVAIACARPSRFCRQYFEDLLLKYGEMHVLKICFSQGLRAAKTGSANRPSKFKDMKCMKYFKHFIPVQKVKQRLISNPKFTEEDRMFIMNFDDGLQSSPDIEDLRKPPESNYAPAFQTSSVQQTRPTQCQVWAPAPSTPQSSGTNAVKPENSNPHSWQSPEYRRSREQLMSGDEVRVADIDQFFGDISRKTIMSGASGEDFLEIQAIILNILAEKIPQYNSK